MLRKLTLNDNEVRVLYALVQHDAEGAYGCPLEQQDRCVAGDHKEHEIAISTLLMKVSDALLDITDPKPSKPARKYRFPGDAMSGPHNEPQF